MNKRRGLLTTMMLGLVMAFALSLSGQVVNAAAPLIFGDTLGSDWQNWSWQTTVNFAATSPVHSGSKSLSATYNAAWAGVYLHANSAVTAGYNTLRFWINGGSGSPSIQVALYDAANIDHAAKTFTATANTWKQVDVPLAAVGSSSNLSGVVWQENSGAAQPAFYLDDIQLLTLNAVPTATPPPSSGPTLQVNAAAGQHAISPDIYGMNFYGANFSSQLADDIQLPVNRWGGNMATRYNYLVNSTNHAMDWYFENIPDDVSADQFVAANKARGSDSLMTIPMIGWVAKDASYSCSFTKAQYPSQQDFDPYIPNCGNGMMPDGKTPITGNNPTDTSTAVDPAFMQVWIAYLQNKFGAANAGGVRFYNLDNEPMLWSETHRDVHPMPLSYDDERDRTYQYAAAIKAADPAALTLGPAEWGWTGYFYSALDMSYPNYWEPGKALDQVAHGGLPLTAWYLSQMKQYELDHGVRILDYLDLHYYPEAVSLSPAGDATTQALRLRSTRSLWDPTYVDESWIGEPVRLIPRMRDWVNTYYPGTKLAITEYNFGGVEHINGALTQADVLGIFGREGLDLATMWDAPNATQPAAYAFRMYRNYDGQGHMFGDTSVQATSSDQGKLSVYAATRADNILTVMVINKTTLAQTSNLNLANFNSGMAQVYSYSAANLDQIIRKPDLTLTANSVVYTYPAQSITLLVIPFGGSSPDAAPPRNYFTVDKPTLTWTTVTWAVRYELQRADNSNFTSAMTFDAGNNLAYTFLDPLTDGTYFWRVRACTGTDPSTCGNWSAYDTFVVDAVP